jgi:N-acyl-phosphatidylethanolamine-hydrolysing phospholipase D
MVQRARRRLLGQMPRDPDPAAFPRDTPRILHPHAPPERLLATWVGHSTFLLQLGGVNVLTDPMWSERASPVSFAGPRRWTAPGIALDALPRIDAVLQTHDHYDHLDRATVRWLSAHHPDARWCAPRGVGARLRRFGVRSVTELDWWEESTLCGLDVLCTPARHFSGRGIHDRDSTLWCGWTLRSRTHRVFIAGDTGMHPEFGAIALRAGPFDLVAIPIGAYEPRWFMRPVHLCPVEAVEAYVRLRSASAGDRGAVLAAMHWGTFRLTDEAMDEPPRRVAAEWRARTLCANRLWVPAHGETREIDAGDAA